MLSFQQIILKLQSYWSQKGCTLLQPYDMEVGAATSHTGTFLRAIGPEPWIASYVQPSRRPKDGRYGKNPHRLQRYHQYQVVFKPVPSEFLDMYLESLKFLGVNPLEHDIRFVEDNWENPTLSASGLGWEVWLDGMEVTQFTYFQQIGGMDCKPITGEITYGLERLAMHLQNTTRVYDLIWTENSLGPISYYDIFYQSELEQSAYNFEHAPVDILLSHFNDYEKEASRLIKIPLVLPAYEVILKAIHAFNLLDSRRVISVTERANYISRIRCISRAIAHAYYESRKLLGFPMLEKKKVSKTI